VFPAFGPLDQYSVLPFDVADCWEDQSNDLCQLVYRFTGNGTAANTADLVVAKPLAILGILALGLLLRWLIFRIIDRVIRQAAVGSVPGMLPQALTRGRAAEALEERGAIALERREQRAQTMGSVLKSITTGVVFTIVAFMVVDQFGYNIAPLIASAGIIGVALGFGAQSLVRDFLSGMFMILEDQYGVGDVINLDADVTGTVEAVGLRVTRLRDVNGTVWYMPNGAITRVGNMSQNWARTVLDINVAYTEDLDRVRAVLGEIAHQLWEDPEHRAKILEEPEVWGVERLDPDRVVVRVVLKTAPLQQWEVARTMRELVVERFEELGIEIPLPQQVVWNKDGADPADATTRRPSSPEA
jgi:small-conductance mechanosensitive channel